jgi:hypothetical protein
MTIINQLTLSTLLAQSETPLGRFSLPKSIFYIDPATGSLGLQPAFNRAVSTTIAVLTVFGGIFFLFQIFIAAMELINAGGNENTIASARQKIFNSIIGLTAVVAAYALVALLATILGLKFFNPLSNIFSTTPALAQHKSQPHELLF